MKFQQLGSQWMIARAKRGFALVVTLSLMILLTVIAVGLLTLSAVSQRSTAQASAKAVAEANARMALMMAIGELQKQLGPDQRISTTADQRPKSGTKGAETSSAPGNRMWTGVFDSWLATTDGRPTPVFRTWLVSGDATRFAKVEESDKALAATEAVELVGKGTLGAAGDNRVQVPAVSFDSSNTSRGRYAWWIGDQGVKAAIATPAPSDDMALAAVRQSMQSAPRNASGLAAAGNVKPFAGLAVDDARIPRVTSWQQATFLASNSADPTAYRPLFHDLAAFSTGLMTNVRAGGFRKDLSMKLEQDQSAVDLSNPANALYSVGGEPGINFQELWAYYQLEKQLQRSGSATFTTGGALDSAKSPYLQITNGPLAVSQDKWHYFKQPVIVSYQLVLSFSMRPAPAPNVGKMCLNVDFDPVLTFWNPLDVPVVLPQDSWFHTGFWQVPYDVNVNLNGTNAKRCSLTRSINGLTAASGSVDYHFLGLNAGKVEPLVFKPGEVIKISQTGNTASGAQRFTGLDGKKGFNYGGGTAVPLLDDTGAVILLNPTDNITYSATANNLTSGQDASSGGNIIAGLGSNNSRRWSLTHNQVLIGSPYGAHSGIGVVAMDWCYGYKRPARVDERTKNNPRNNKTSANSTRLYANNFPDVFAPIAGAQDTRSISASSINNRKQTFMLLSYDAKTEVDSKRGTRFLSRFNPKAFHVDFYSLSQQERDVLPYEVAAIPLLDWRNAPLDQSTNGNGFYGGSLRSEQGSSFITTHSVPREPIVSLAAFQNSFANGFNFLSPAYGVDNVNDREPLLPQISHAIGNSVAPPMFAADKTEGVLPGDPHPLADHSYLANRALWDDYFLSGIAGQRTPAFSKNRDQKTVASEFFLTTKAVPLPVRRYLPALDGKDANQLLTTFFSGGIPTAAAIDTLASYLRVDGLFNVNSTSVEAWKAVLGSLKDRPVVVRNESGVESIAPKDAKTPVAALASPKDVISKDELVLQGDQWVGRRTLTDDEIGELALAIVKEVRKRGPFLCLADFVNRRVGTDKDLAKSGAIQSALDSGDVTINKNQNTRRSVPSAVSARFAFPEAEQGAINYGSPVLVKQGDILTPIAPVLSARSDSFIIRTYGEAKDGNGKVIASAWCEAVVERDRKFVDPSEKAETLPTSLSSSVNKTFGRRFNLISFRWLNPREI